VGASRRETIGAVCDAIDADFDRACELSFDALPVQEQLALLERCERVAPAHTGSRAFTDQ
jgi:hypothetical protein